MAINDFSQLKKNRNKEFDKLAKKIEEGDKKKSFGDDRIWTPTVDKAGNGTAVIRFLPPSPGSDDPYVKLFNHGFQSKKTGQWLIDDCPTTVGKDCPICKYNGSLWNSGIDANKEIASAQKRRLNYYSNIMVIKDPENPQNEGKVFLYRYGVKIFEMIQSTMFPEFDDEEAINPFDFWEGANFKLRIRNVAGFRNYDKSEFSKVSPLSDDDSELEKIWNQQYDLSEFVDPERFKSYDELQTRLNRVLGVEADGVQSEGMTGSAEEMSMDNTSNQTEYKPPFDPDKDVETNDNSDTAESKGSSDDDDIDWDDILDDD